MATQQGSPSRMGCSSSCSPGNTPKFPPWYLVPLALHNETSYGHTNGSSSTTTSMGRTVSTGKLWDPAKLGRTDWGSETKGAVKGRNRPITKLSCHCRVQKKQWRLKMCRLLDGVWGKAACKSAAMHTWVSHQMYWQVVEVQQKLSNLSVWGQHLWLRTNGHWFEEGQIEIPCNVEVGWDAQDPAEDEVYIHSFVRVITIIPLIQRKCCSQEYKWAP